MAATGEAEAVDARGEAATAEGAASRERQRAPPGEPREAAEGVAAREAAETEEGATEAAARAEAALGAEEAQLGRPRERPGELQVEAEMAMEGRVGAPRVE